MRREDVEQLSLPLALAHPPYPQKPLEMWPRLQVIAPHVHNSRSFPASPLRNRCDHAAALSDGLATLGSGHSAVCSGAFRSVGFESVN